MTSLCLNHPLISTAEGPVHLRPAPSKRQITPHMLLPACFRDHYHLRSYHCAHFHFSHLPSLTAPSSIFSAALHQLQPKHALCTSVNIFPLCPRTREGDVEALQRYGEVRNEA